MNLIFYSSGIFSILCTFIILFQDKPIYILLYFIVSLLFISGMFFSLGAFFAASLEVIIYAGAVMVLFLFFVMLTKMESKIKNLIFNKFYIIRNLFLFLCSIFFFWLILKKIIILNNKYITFKIIPIENIGIFFFKENFLLLELISLLILSSVILISIFATNQQKHFEKIKKESKK